MAGLGFGLSLSLLLFRFFSCRVGAGVPRQAVTFFLLAQKESNQRKRAQYELVALAARGVFWRTTEV